jgi:hypothetical protein
VEREERVGYMVNSVACAEYNCALNIVGVLITMVTTFTRFKFQHQVHDIKIQ